MKTRSFRRFLPHGFAVVALVSIVSLSGIPEVGAATTAFSNVTLLNGVSNGISGSPALNAPTVGCWSSGNCEAIGSYVDGNGDERLYVAAERAGSWGTATTVPMQGLTPTSPATYAPQEMSCSGPSNCALVGTYGTTAAIGTEIFVASDAGGTWSAPVEIPGLAALDAGQSDAATSIYCVGTSCVVAGTFDDGQGNTQPFVATSNNGIWGKATTISGTVLVAGAGYANVGALNCASPGNCILAGDEIDATNNYQAFTATETFGTWGPAQLLPGVASLSYFYSQVTTLSCSTPSFCVAAGVYTDATGSTQGFVSADDAGSWSTAQPIPGLDTLNAGGTVTVDALSCSLVECWLGGSYAADSAHQEGFLANVTRSSFGTAAPVSGLAALNVGDQSASADVTALSCASDDTCGAAGTFTASDGSTQGFVATATGDTWQAAEAIPGLMSVVNPVTTSVETLACSSGSNCSVVGLSTSGTSGDIDTFGSIFSNGAWSPVVLFSPAEQLLMGGSATGESMACWSPGNCLAVGAVGDQSGDEAGWYAFETAGVWGSTTDFPANAEYPNFVPTTAFCTTAGCTVVGQASDAGNQKYAYLAYGGTGGVWGPSTVLTSALTPTLAALGSSSANLTCFKSGCDLIMGVQFADGATAVTKGVANAFGVIAYQLMGATWSAPTLLYESPVIASGSQNYQGDDLSASNCPTFSHCVVADEYFQETASGYQSTSGLHVLAGGSWTHLPRFTGVKRTQNKTQSERFAYVSSIQCSTSSCLLFENASEAQGPIGAATVVSLNGTTLGSSRPLLGVPSTAYSSNVQDASCTSSLKCEVTLTYENVVGSVASSRATTFVVVDVVTPTSVISQATVGSFVNSFGASTQVTCASAASCALGVSIYSSSGDQSTYASFLAGGKWTAAAVVKVKGKSVAILTSIVATSDNHYQSLATYYLTSSQSTSAIAVIRT